MNDRLFVDTNVLIRVFEGDEAAIALTDDQVVHVSVVTEMEMQCKPHQSADERAIIQEMLRECVVIELSASIKQWAIRILRATRLKLLDAVVAASAIELALPLLTGDEKFSSVK